MRLTYYLLPLVLLVCSPAAAAFDRPQTGEVSFINSSAPAAQRPFLEALAHLHNFEYGRAAVAFRAAQQIDPAFVMAYWGEADPPSLWWTPMLAFRSWRGVSDECSTPGVSGIFQARGR